MPVSMHIETDWKHWITPAVSVIMKSWREWSVALLLGPWDFWVELG